MIFSVRTHTLNKILYLPIASILGIESRCKLTMKSKVKLFDNQKSTQFLIQITILLLNKWMKLITLKGTSSMKMHSKLKFMPDKRTLKKIKKREEHTKEYSSNLQLRCLTRMTFYTV